MFMLMPAFTARGSRSIGVGFASATVLMAKSKATGIKGFIGLAFLLNASGNHRIRPLFRTAIIGAGMLWAAPPTAQEAGKRTGGLTGASVLLSEQPNVGVCPYVSGCLLGRLLRNPHATDTVQDRVGPSADC